jgi:hypothetical protein
MTTPTLLSSLPPEGALCSGPAEPDPRKLLEVPGLWPALEKMHAVD